MILFVIFNFVTSLLAARSCFGLTMVSPSSSTTLASKTPTPHWQDHLKFGGTEPEFDVIAKTIEYTSTPGYRSFSLRDIPNDYYADDYVFRGPIVGPINRSELVETNSLFALQEAFPDLDRQTFGFAVDPENPYRVLYFERWKGMHTGTLTLQGTGISVPPTGKQSISPAFPFSIVWNPDGKIVYEHLTTAVDRFEGNTMGKVAVFGLLETAGVSLPNNVGNPFLTWIQKFNRFLNRPAQVYSKRENIPSWWKSQAVGAEPNDM